MVLYALLTPLMFLAGAAASDLGWYYLNYSRLQDAADAAAIAGAQEIGKSKNIRPVLVNEYLGDLSSENADANERAQQFLQMNYDINALKDTEKFSLYQYQDEENKTSYYVVNLTEKNFKHLFNIFDSVDLEVSARAIAKITFPNNNSVGIDLNTQMKNMAETKVFDNLERAWYNNENIPDGSLPEVIPEGTTAYELLKKYEITPTSDSQLPTYVSGNLYRTESLEVLGNGNKSGRGKITSPLDHIFLDFKADLNYDFTEDWDISSARNSDEVKPKINAIRLKGDAGGYDLRIHTSIKFGAPYVVRPGHEPPDPFYVRIESEPIRNLKDVPGKEGHKAYSSVRQIILNFTVSNFDSATEKFRPLIIFYTGPEKIDENSDVRNSQPVIFNLKADYRCILYAPNSPVVILGNNKKFEGFIVAKEFVELKGESDFTKNAEGEFFDGDKQYYKTTKDGFTMFIDEKGNVQTKPVSSSASTTSDKTGTIYKREYFKLNSSSQYADFGIINPYEDINFQQIQNAQDRKDFLFTADRASVIN